MFPIIIGVILGFAIGEGTRWFREKLRIRKLKIMIKEELKSIRNQVIKKKEIIEPKINQLEKTGNITDPFDNSRDIFVKIMNTGYNNYFPELYEHFSIPERNHIHAIYERLDFTERTIALLEKEDFNQHKFIGTLGAHRTQFKEILESYDKILDLINEYFKEK